MNSDPVPAPRWPDANEVESASPDPASPFLDSSLQLGARARPPSERSESNPISRQLATVLPASVLESEPVPASIPLRVAAKLTDWFLVGTACFATVLLWTSRLPWAERSAAFSLAFVLALPGLWAVASLYQILLNGNTVGKRLFGLEIVTDAGAPLSPGRNFGRVWAESLSWAVLCLGYLVALFDPARRTLHDHLCGTRVVLRQAR